MPEDGRRFRTGAPCLDLVHTGGAEEHAGWEILHSPQDLAALLPTLVRRAGTFAVTPADLAATRALRAAVTRCAFAAIGGAELPAADVAAINAAAAAPSLISALDAAGGQHLVDPTGAQAVATLARDAVDLFGSPLRQRIRMCAAVDCGLLLVDTSRPGKRKWCSMNRCGNLAKIRRHRGRPEPEPLEDMWHRGAQEPS